MHIIFCSSISSSLQGNGMDARVSAGSTIADSQFTAKLTGARPANANTDTEGKAAQEEGSEDYLRIPIRRAKSTRRTLIEAPSGLRSVCFNDISSRCLIFLFQTVVLNSIIYSLMSLIFHISLKTVLRMRVEK